MPDKNMYQRVLLAINKVRGDFKRNPNLFLSEGDLQCRLFAELQRLFPKEGVTEDRQNETSFVHSQIRYMEGGRFDKNNVDLVVVEPRNFNFKDFAIVYRKGYSFSEPSIAIELKLCKIKENRDSLQKRWEKDLVKLNRLKQRRYDSIFISLLFDKFNLLSNSVVSRLETEYLGIKIFYQNKQLNSI
jgi:hypothetical protein